MEPGSADRVASLDLIRGVAVLGILAVNIAGFAAPGASAYSPDLPHAGSAADHAAYAAILVVFEGKMRALFSLLFGASLLLFVDRKENAGEDGQGLQLRRLGWLAVFGYLHFLLLWWGDILFLYAIAGVVVLALRLLPSPATLAAALLMFAIWQANGVLQSLPTALAEAAAEGRCTPQQAKQLAQTQAYHRNQNASETLEYRSGFVAQVGTRLTGRPFYPISAAFYSLGETVPYMLIGLLLMRSGFFSGRWRRSRLWALAIGGVLVGGAATLVFTAWAWPRGFPPEAMRLAINFALGVPHLLMALGYAACLVLATPRLLATRLGARLAAAGRMAFSNYLGTSLLMGAMFYGWGLDLFGRFDRAALSAFVVLGWVVMLGWSRPWLDRFDMGPLEALWRRLASPRLTDTSD